MADHTWQTKMQKSQFEKLKNKWDKKLLDSGFTDIENKDGTLKAETDPRTIANALKMKESREIYYTQAREFLNTHRWSNNKDKAIWEGHCEGLSFRRMAEILSLTYYRINIIINKLQKQAGLKNEK